MSIAFELARSKTAEPLVVLYEALYGLVKDGIGAPPMEESIKWGNLMFHRGTENLIALIPQKGRINLQFFNGAHLANATGLLEGTGKDLRHVKVTGLDFLTTYEDDLLTLVAESVQRGANVR